MNEKYHLSPGNYTVKNNTKYTQQVNIISNEERRERGYNEPADAKAHLIKPFECEPIIIPENYHLTVSGNPTVIIDENNLAIEAMNAEEAVFEYVKFIMRLFATYPQNYSLLKSLSSNDNKRRGKSIRKFVLWAAKQPTYETMQKIIEPYAKENRNAQG